MKPLLVGKDRVSEITMSYKNKVKAKDRMRISHSDDSYKAVKPLFKDCIEYTERFIALYLNRAGHVLAAKVISDGISNSTVVDPPSILAPALKLHASSVILAHNHPSGNKSPSKTDIMLTKKIIGACDIMEIECLDHLIVTRDSYTSFRDDGLIK